MADARTHYRENAVRGASAVRHVVLLYEQVVEDLRRAAKAITQNNIEARTNAINHAIVIIGALQSRLNFEVGGKVARDLNRFYNTTRRSLIDAQFQASQEILKEQIDIFLNMREAWTEVERREQPVAPHAAPSAADLGEHKPRADWRV